MKKLAAIDGLEILKEEKHVHDGVEYPYRIVAKVKDGLYVEAKDPLYEQATAPEKLPQKIDSDEVTTEFLQLECSQSTLTSPNVSNRYIVIPSEQSLVMEAYGASFLVGSPAGPTSTRKCTVATCVESSPKDSGIYSFGAPVLSFPSGAKISGKDNVEEAPFSISFTGNDWAYFENDDGTVDGYLKGIQLNHTDASGAGWSGFGVCLNVEALHDLEWEPVYSKGYGTRKVLFLGSQRNCSVLVVSGTVFRVSSSVSPEGDLVFPSTWQTLPCVPTVMTNQGGLFFCYNSAEIRSGVIAAITLDTSKGNGLEGSFPAIYDSGVLCGVHAVGGERLHVQGSPSNPSGTVAMQVFVPEVPIPTDSVSGGPVVTDLFAYSSQEIRGALPGLLGVPEALSVGSVGWLDGKRYRVHLPGRMLQIG
ncbi:hypothetical protein [Dethiosulfovibrio faecalis]|uniref:hypothetical protein n=1 Tax=Dethiosulfovibrio faecalis TaxID=2720018 RepID=UPI003B830E66